jgi:hypothetical protein
LLEPDEAELLVCAAWLHDIGYAATIAATGFHPLDGARHLRALGAPMRLCALVANHTAASVEAEVRGLASQLGAEFPAEPSGLTDALTHADMTAGPEGQELTVEERLSEILTRYPEGSVVNTAIRTASRDLVETVRRVERRLAAAGGRPVPRAGLRGAQPR